MSDPLRLTDATLEVLVALVAHERVPALRGAPVFQHELRAITGLSLAGVSRSLVRLEAAGLVDITRPGQSGHGRLPYAYRARAGAAEVLERVASDVG